MKSYGKGKKTELTNSIPEAPKCISGSTTGTADDKSLYQQLRYSEDKYISLFELTPIGNTILDTLDKIIRVTVKDIIPVTSRKVRAGAIISQSYYLQRYFH